MSTYVPTYLRPLSRVRTGNQSRIDKKAEQVEDISCPGIDSLRVEQHDSVDLWANKQAYQGRSVVDSDEEIRVDKSVDHPKRHWWVISQGLLEDVEPPLREHADIFDLLITLNLCTNDPVFFSQSPGQVIGGAYRYERGALSYRNDLSPGNIGRALLGMGEIPKKITLSGDIPSVYERVRHYRSKQISRDAEVDIRVALHMYDDALSSNIWTTASNLYFVCENVLTSGWEGNAHQLIGDQTVVRTENARAWRELVNRLKHPDTGEDVDGFLDQEGLSIPSPQRMKQAANTVLKEKMEEMDV